MKPDAVDDYGDRGWIAWARAEVAQSKAQRDQWALDWIASHDPANARPLI
jgi:hypothetical protein